MRASVAGLALGLYLATAAGCALHHAEEPNRKGDRTVLTQEQIAVQHFNTVYGAVEALRSNWLQTRGTDSFQNPSDVRVYLDNTLLGGVQKLREIAANTVTFIKYFDGVAATARWGGRPCGRRDLSVDPPDDERSVSETGSDPV